MSVHSWRELPRVNTHRFGESPQFERRFVLTLNDPNTNSGVMVTAVGAAHGSSHPEAAAARCYELEVNEAYEDSRYHAELIARYEIPLTENEYSLLPWQRPDKWSFITQGVAVPALFYFDEDTQEITPLVNSANDFLEGLMRDEGQQKIIIESNRQFFPSALAAEVTNTVNESAYLGFPEHHVKVQGISGEQAQEEINGQTVRYWKIKSELIGRQSGWNLLIPDVGFNFIEDNTKKRAFIEGPDGEDVASVNPVGLDGEGEMVPAGDLPAILNRRVYKQISMSQYFGTPPS